MKSFNGPGKQALYSIELDVVTALNFGLSPMRLVEMSYVCK